MINKNKKIRSPQRDLLYFFGIIMVLFVLLMSKAHAQQVRTVRLADETIARIGISARGTVLSFPIKPTKVILGNQGAFGVEYVESDLAITPLSAAGRSHLFVYLYGRRFSFDLVTDLGSGTAIVLVRDALDVPTATKSKADSSRASATKHTSATKTQATPVQKK